MIPPSLVLLVLAGGCCCCVVVVDRHDGVSKDVKEPTQWETRRVGYEEAIIVAEGATSMLL